MAIALRSPIFSVSTIVEGTREPESWLSGPDVVRSASLATVEQTGSYVQSRRQRRGEEELPAPFAMTMPDADAEIFNRQARTWVAVRTVPP